MTGVDCRIVLVVDDEVFARLFAVQIFLDEGFTVLEASDAAEGLEMLESNDDVGLLFTDISMPGEMDGLDLIARVRKDRPDLRFVATSGQALPADQPLPPGACFLPKPYTAQALMTAIREVSSSSSIAGVPVHAVG